MGSEHKLNNMVDKYIIGEKRGSVVTTDGSQLFLGGQFLIKKDPKPNPTPIQKPNPTPIQIWDIATGNFKRPVILRELVHSLCVSPDGE